MALVMIVVLMVNLSCSTTTKTFSSFSDWDTDSNRQIGRREFVDAYLAQDYFEKWSTGGSISYSQLYDQAFASMDGDKDEKLSIEEFTAQIRLFYFGLFSGSFDLWDDNRDESLSKKEFADHVSTTNLATLWDSNGDKRITEAEMAGGMFYLCDANSNGNVDEQELALWKKNR